MISDGMPTPRRYLAVTAISLGTALTIIDGAIANVALPTISRDLHVDGSAAVLVVTIYQLVLVMSLLPFSALGDRIGLKRMYQGGQLVFTLATALCFFAKTLPFLLIVRAVQALGAAAALSVMQAVIRQIYPAKHLGRGLGFNTVIAASSGALGPAAGGLILAVAPWPWVFAAGVPFAILSLIIGRFGLPDLPGRKVPYDGLGAFYCSLTLGLFFFGLEACVHGGPPVIGLAIVGVAAIFAVAFIRHELGQDYPIMPVDLLAQPVIALSAGGAFCAFIGTTMLTLSLPFRLQHAYGFGPGEVGAAIAPWALTSMIVSPTAGMLSDGKIPAGLLGGIGMVVATLALLLFAFLPTHPDYIAIAWRMSLCGAGFGLYMSPNARLIIGSAPRHRATAAGGLTSTIRLTGQTLGATLVATLLSFGFGEGPVPPLAAMVLAVIAGVCSVMRLNPALHRPGPGEAEPLA
jgi:DHA2 family multidrug resistance protein-like MFS transporter